MCVVVPVFIKENEYTFSFLRFRLRKVHFYTPPHFSVGVLCYTFRSLSICPSVHLSVRPCSPFPIDNLSIYSQNFFKFCIHIVIGDEWYGIVNGQNLSILTELLPFFVLEKWFLACYSFTVHDIWMKLHRYVAHQRLHIVTKNRHSDLPSLWVIRPW